MVGVEGWERLALPGDTELGLDSEVSSDASDVSMHDLLFDGKYFPVVWLMWGDTYFCHMLKNSFEELAFLNFFEKAVFSQEKSINA